MGHIFIPEAVDKNKNIWNAFIRKERGESRRNRKKIKLIAKIYINVLARLSLKI